MAKKQEQENAADMLRQFDSLKQKHPDAMLLFRKGDFYEMSRRESPCQVHPVSPPCLGRVSAQTDTFRAEGGHL